MINKKFFIQCIERLSIEFGDKGFKMTDRRLEQWYSFFKDFDKNAFDAMIDGTLKNCNHCPSMADVMKQQPEYMPNEICL